MANARVAQQLLLPFVSAPAEPKALRRLLRGLRDALVRSQKLAVEREIVWLVELTGGNFTDDTEREIESILPSQTRR
jgi:hypothetical protein